MKAFLKGCSEQVDFETKTIKHFLHFEREDGLKFELPSTEEATHQLVGFLGSDTAPAEVPEDLEIYPVVASQDPLEGATEFGGDVDEGFGDLPSETDARPSFEVHDPNEVPQNEEEVPSL